ncbi:hypothetical protein QSH18_11150 [Xanthomonas sp. NCPPB 2654]|uniref:hypothetical protein n=1 Tax=unclassified Xanthomonas TaxID=2643310 RepID=UPI0021DFD0B6|nr:MULTISPECIES: hypothetical protein [unclassified Xanthomonas]MDL5366163.1 hypothetical protein [Xanthomonas sp. NCPPB 2654]UYC21481.1 hypothetical protein NUG20_04010 [Xanthomonas sp. CFBP 8443]
MIVGNGLLASAFEQKAIEALGATIFASGVSNSNEVDPAAYAREKKLLCEHLKLARGTFVYFSTCSIADPDRGVGAYARHKKLMEEEVATRDDYLILRLPQVVGHTANPNTLTNFLASRIAEGVKIPLWSGAIRCLVDVEHVAAITLELLRQPRPMRVLGDIAPPEVVTMPELIDMLESVMGVRTQRELIDRGGGSRPDPELMLSLSHRLGLDISTGYTARLLRKYYGRPDAP